jgi:hypothetical protein
MLTDLGFEVTELRHSLHGSGGEEGEERCSSNKRGFSETIDLNLKLKLELVVTIVEEEKEVTDKEDMAVESLVQGKVKRSSSLSSVITAIPHPPPHWPVQRLHCCDRTTLEMRVSSTRINLSDSQ